MDNFIEFLEATKVLTPIKRHLVVLGGYKSHIPLDVIVKAKQHRVDLITLLVILAMNYSHLMRHAIDSLNNHLKHIEMFGV